MNIYALDHHFSILLKNGEFKKASQLINTIFEITLDSANFFQGQMSLSGAKNNFDSVIYYYHKIRNVRKGFNPYSKTLLNAYLAEQKYDSIIKLDENLLNLYASSKYEENITKIVLNDFLSIKGTACYLSGQIDLAIQTLSKIKEENGPQRPTYRQGKMFLALSYSLMEEYDMAMNVISELIFNENGGPDIAVSNDTRFRIGNDGRVQFVSRSSHKDQRDYVSYKIFLSSLFKFCKLDENCLSDRIHSTFLSGTSEHHLSPIIALSRLLSERDYKGSLELIRTIVETWPEQSNIYLPFIETFFLEVLKVLVDDKWASRSESSYDEIIEICNQMNAILPHSKVFMIKGMLQISESIASDDFSRLESADLNFSEALELRKEIDVDGIDEVYYYKAVLRAMTLNVTNAKDIIFFLDKYLEDPEGLFSEDAKYLKQIAKLFLEKKPINGWQINFNQNLHLKGVILP